MSAELHHDFLEEDPSVRASYSANPSFVTGADEAHPIDSAEKSLLVQPRIAEAMEAVYVSESDEAQSEVAEPIDFELAKCGLGWLRDNVDGELKRKVVMAKSAVAGMESDQKLRQERDRALEEQNCRLEMERADAARVEVERRARAAIEEARQAGYREILDRHVETIRQDRPDLNFDNFLELSGEVEIDETPEGEGLSGRQKRGFQSKVTHRVHDYLRRPQELVNDLEVINLIQDRAEDSDAAVLVYNAQIFFSLSKLLDNSYYPLSELSPDIIREWLELAVDQESTSRAWLPEARKAQAGELDDQATVATAMGIPAMGYGSLILINSLGEIARNQKLRLVDAMYPLAKEGLTHQDPRVHEATFNMLVHCLLTEPAAPSLLYMSSVSHNDRLRRKALDICQTLNAAGKEGTDIPFQALIDRSQAKMTVEEVAAVYDLFKREIYSDSSDPSVDAETHAQEVDKRQEKYMAEFKHWVTTTPEGAESTIYGRYLAQTQ